MLKCLQNNMYHVSMSDTCRKEVESDYKASLGDSSLRYSMNMNCVQDIKEICAVEKAHEELANTILATSATIAKSLSGAKISGADVAELGLAGDVQKCLADNYKNV